MRNYQWRKYKLECIIKRKLKIYSSKCSPDYYNSFIDVNGFSYKSPLWMNYLNSRIYYNIISYNYYSKYLIKNKESNCISISIPELTDAYFRNIFIKGEYVLIKNGALWWRGKCYVK